MLRDPFGMLRDIRLRLSMLRDPCGMLRDIRLRLRMLREVRCTWIFLAGRRFSADAGLPLGWDLFPGEVTS
jgi:hypothetical protein